MNTVAAVMSARLHVNKPLLRRSSLALNRINVHVGSRKGSSNGSHANAVGGSGVNGEGAGHYSDGNAFEELRIFVKQVSTSVLTKSGIIKQVPYFVLNSIPSTAITHCCIL